MSQTRRWRCAVLGAGMAGEHNIRALSKSTHAELVGVCELDHAKAAALLEKHQTPATPIYPDLATLLAERQVDVLHIATPSAFHHEAALAAFEHKVNVICEKPLDISLDRIDRMIAAAKHHGVRLAGIFQNRWNPANRTLRDFIQQGRFGTLTWAGAFVLWYRDAKYYAGWRGTRDIDGGGAIMNNSIHSIDLLQWLVGPIQRVSAVAARRMHPSLQTEDTLSATLEFAGGALGSIVGTTAMFPQRPARIEIGGTEGSAVVEGQLKELKFKNARDGDDALLQPQPQQDFHLLNIDHILSSWSANRDSEVEGPACRKAVEIVLALYESAERRGASVELS